MATKKPDQKKSTSAKSTAVKKTPANKVAAKKPAAKKAPAKKATPKKAAVKKAPSKKAPAKKVAVKKAPQKKAPVKKAPAKKVAAKKAPAKKATAKQTPAKNNAAAKTPAKKPSAKAPAAKQPPAKKTVTKKTPPSKPSSGKSAGKKSTAAGSTKVARAVGAVQRFDDFKPYKPARGESYMNEEQLEHFKGLLLHWRGELVDEVTRTVSHMKDEAANFPDPADRATQEEEFSLELRTRDRERKLIKKIDGTLERILNDDYGYCDACGIEIGIQRLEARPTATLCIDCKTLAEIKEKQELG